MRKFLLVTLIGMALAIYLYGIVSKLMIEEVKEIDHIKETTTTVYMEQHTLFLLDLSIERICDPLKFATFTGTIME